jgi:hypothetical protein
MSADESATVPPHVPVSNRQNCPAGQGVVAKEGLPRDGGEDDAAAAAAAAAPGVATGATTAATEDAEGLVENEKSKSSQSSSPPPAPAPAWPEMSPPPPEGGVVPPAAVVDGVCAAGGVGPTLSTSPPPDPPLAIEAAAFIPSHPTVKKTDSPTTRHAIRTANTPRQHFRRVVLRFDVLPPPVPFIHGHGPFRDPDLGRTLRDFRECSSFSRSCMLSILLDPRLDALLTFSTSSSSSLYMSSLSSSSSSSSSSTWKLPASSSRPRRSSPDDPLSSSRWDDDLAFRLSSSPLAISNSGEAASPPIRSS